LLCCFFVVWTCGCQSTATHDTRPRARLGGLPFPGFFTLYERGDAKALGTHEYAVWNELGIGHTEGRGILYTCAAGFLDLDHVRTAADWTWYLSRHVERALTLQQPVVVVVGEDPTRYEIAFNYPPFWHGMDSTTRARVIEEASIRMAQRIAFQMSTWHEIITWYGYKSMLIIPEDRSAFTYEDTMSHIVGVLIGGDAIRDNGDYDAAMTRILDTTLQRLGAVSGADTTAAIRLVEGKWWSSGQALKRYLEIGLESRSLRPWLVEGLPCCAGAEPMSFTLPSLEDVSGHDCSQMYAVTMTPQIFETHLIQSKFALPAPRIEPVKHFPQLMEHIRRDMVKALGPDVDRP
jgi:hypothetical protein